MTQATMFARLTKVDEAKRQVTGVIASETPDLAKEICDYESSKPNFLAWSGALAKASNGASVGNLRAMHGKVAAGKLTELTCDDMTKTIEVVAEVVDDNEWNKVLKGVYTGFSIGGSYGKKWDDPMLKGHKRYTAKPSEVSLVDYGCNPDATFVMVKADGMEENVPFHHPDEAELLGKLNDAEATAEDKADAAQRLAKLYAPADEEELSKGAYSIGQLARLAEDVACFMKYSSCTFDDAGTPIAKSFTPEVKAAASSLYDALLKMVAEDVSAAQAQLKTAFKKYVDEETDGGLAKFATLAKDLGVEIEGAPLLVVVEDSSLGKFIAAPEHAEALTKAIAIAGTEHDALTKVFGNKAFGIEEGAVLDDAVESINKYVSAHDVLVNEHEELKKRAEPAKGNITSVPVGKGSDGTLQKEAPATGSEQKDPLVLMKDAQSRPMRIGMSASLAKPA